MNEPVALTNAAIATDAAKAPVLFLKIPVTLAAVEVWKKEEGKRGVRDCKAAAGQVLARINYLHSVALTRTKILPNSPPPHHHLLTCWRRQKRGRACARPKPR